MSLSAKAVIMKTAAAGASRRTSLSNVRSWRSGSR
jgi:hypothetical protein